VSDILQLRDGRTLGFAEYGVRSPKVLFYFHGYPGSRVEARLLAEPAERLGIRLIEIDRPGMGLSTFKLGRRFSDWPADVAELADDLGIDRFSLIGCSGGAPYAIAWSSGNGCGIRLPPQSAECSQYKPALSKPENLKPLRLVVRSHTPLPEVFRALFVTYRQRTLVGLSLMTAQCFFYNAILFTYALVLSTFYGVPHERVGWYIFPFAVGNVLGPLLLGPLFDRVGRKPMIAATYSIAGLLLAVSAFLFAEGLVDAKQQTIAWMIVFFFASAAASAAYLTVSEVRARQYRSYRR
jgi:hypothetical protein